MNVTFENKRKSLKLTTLGFTLIELLTAIVIMSIIAVIAIPRFINVLDNSKEKLYDKNIETILSAARTYLLENMNNYIDDEEFTIELSSLCEKKLISCPIVNPITDEVMNGEIKVTVVNEKYNYKYIE